MEYSIQKKNIIMIVLIFFFIIGIIGLIFYVNLKKQATVTAKATVTYIGKDYIVVEDEDNNEYLLPTDQEYNIGDRVSFIMKDIKKDSNPKEGVVEKIDTISRSVQFDIMDSKEDESEANQNISEENSTETSPTKEEKMTDDNIVSYFETLNTNLDSYQNNSNLGATIKSGFITMVDFLFYDGRIGGKTFQKLSTTAKLKVLKLALTIDSKIDKYFPGYKEQLSETGTKIYTNLKSKVVETYLDITTKVCENDPDTCQAAKEGLTDLKNSFSLTWNFIKDISGVGVSKLKAWYEIWKNC